jgi:CheY-like chemotaxis protein
MVGTLLLADDSITIQKVVELTFAETEHKVISVSSGRELFRRLPEVKPDVILCDVVMPDLNGYDVCQSLKSDPATLHLPVVLLTGTFEPFDRDRALAAGCDAIVTKPFEAKELIGVVEDLLRRSQSVAAMPMEPESGALHEIGVPDGVPSLDYTTTGFDKMVATPPPPPTIPEHGIEITSIGLGDSHPKEKPTPPPELAEAPPPTAEPSLAPVEPAAPVAPAAPPSPEPEPAAPVASPPLWEPPSHATPPPPLWSPHPEQALAAYDVGPAAFRAETPQVTTTEPATPPATEPMVELDPFAFGKAAAATPAKPAPEVELTPTIAAPSGKTAAEPVPATPHLEIERVTLAEPAPAPPPDLEATVPSGSAAHAGGIGSATAPFVPLEPRSFAVSEAVLPAVATAKPESALADVSPAIGETSPKAPTPSIEPERREAALESWAASVFDKSAVKGPEPAPIQPPEPKVSRREVAESAARTVATTAPAIERAALPEIAVAVHMAAPTSVAPVVSEQLIDELTQRVLAQIPPIGEPAPAEPAPPLITEDFINEVTVRVMAQLPPAPAPAPPSLTDDLIGEVTVRVMAQMPPAPEPKPAPPLVTSELVDQITSRVTAQMPPPPAPARVPPAPPLLTDELIADITHRVTAQMPPPPVPTPAPPAPPLLTDELVAEITRRVTAQLPPPAPAPAAAEAAAAPGPLSAEDLDRLAHKVLELSQPLLERIAWEVLPDMAEMVVRRRITELEQAAELEA